MNVHEYQAKALLQEYGVPLLKGKMAQTSQEAVAAAQEIGGKLWVVKAQIHAGGRGQGGGVLLAHSLEEVEEKATHILGMNLVTHQTGPEGKVVHRVFIEEGCDIDKEFYVSLLVDRAVGGITLMACAEGGVDIEEIAAHSPEKIHKVSIPAWCAKGELLPFYARQCAVALGLSGSLKEATIFFQSLYRAFVKTDSSLLEINPLVLTKQKKLLALDAKMSFDTNALYRHPEVMALRDPTEEEATESEAAKMDLAFIKLDGQIGCLVNGAGLAMATMDIIKYHGGQPANFLDVGGGASKEKVTKAFGLILKDPHVKSILVNIFGGIMKCDIIAEGVIAATKDLGLNVPLVVRLEGTRVEQARKLLANSGLQIISASDLTDAAKKAVAAVAQTEA